MSDSQRAALNRWIELIYKVGTPLGLAALFFLKTQFATKDDLSLLAARLDRLETAVLVMTEQNKVSERQQRQIDDHEARVRLLEARR